MGQATAVVVIVGLVWRTVRYALAFPLWGDEAFLAINVLTRDFAGLARPLEFDQVAPPGFLWAELIMARTFGTSEWSLRLVPFLAGVASLLLFWRFCRQVAGRHVMLLAVAVFAASFYPVRHANEVKPYAIDLLVSLILTTLGWAVWQDPRSARRWLALLTAAAVGVWCSYPAIFPAVGIGLPLGVRVWRQRTPRSLAFGLAYALLLGASWAAVFLTFAGPQGQAASWQPDSATWRSAFPPVSRPWLLPWWLLTVHTGNMLAYPHGGRNFGSTLTFLLVVIGAWAVWKRRRPLLWLLLSPLPFALAAAALHRYPYGTSARVTLYLAPAVCLLFGEGLAALLRARGKLAIGSVRCAGLIALFPLLATVHDLQQPYTRSDDVENRRLARLLADWARPGDEWVCLNGATPPRHFPDLMLAPWMQQVAEVRFYLLSLAPVPIRWEPDPNQVKAPSEGRTWLIIHQHGSPENYPIERLNAYRQALIARLGQPRITRFPLSDSGSLEVCAFPSNTNLDRKAATADSSLLEKRSWPRRTSLQGAGSMRSR